jgi:hypothetical protein
LRERVAREARRMRGPLRKKIPLTRPVLASLGSTTLSLKERGLH